MYNAKYIIPGLVIFLLLIVSPMIFNVATFTTYEKPKLMLPAGEKECIYPVEFMRAEHMQVLNTWRDEVVREGKRVFTSPNGKKYEMSLQNTCMKCHTNKAEFCDKCHDSASVTPYCWSCHIEPRGNN